MKKTLTTKSKGLFYAFFALTGVKDGVKRRKTDK